MGLPQNVFLIENPTQMDDLGVLHGPNHAPKSLEVFAASHLTELPLTSASCSEKGVGIGNP